MKETVRFVPRRPTRPGDLRDPGKGTKGGDLSWSARGQPDRAPAPARTSGRFQRRIRRGSRPGDPRRRREHRQRPARRPRAGAHRETMPASSRYTLFHQGHGQMLDHMLVTRNLLPITAGQRSTTSCCTTSPRRSRSTRSSPSPTTLRSSPPSRSDRSLAAPADDVASWDHRRDPGPSPVRTVSPSSPPVPSDTTHHQYGQPPPVALPSLLQNRARIKGWRAVNIRARCAIQTSCYPLKIEEPQRALRE